MRCLIRGIQLSRTMAYYLLTAFVIGGALALLHWAVLAA